MNLNRKDLALILLVVIVFPLIHFKFPVFEGGYKFTAYGEKSHHEKMTQLSDHYFKKAKVQKSSGHKLAAMKNSFLSIVVLPVHPYTNKRLKERWNFLTSFLNRKTLF